MGVSRNDLGAAGESGVLRGDVPVGWMEARAERVDVLELEVD